MEIINKRGEITLASGWRKQRTHVVSPNGVASVFGVGAHIV
jgi:hypothetical protein